ncbi:hypothetical protein QAD02_017839 [Eretmocerus hayati]|uniref:Uncharacterized protein n=1 Tax=Eretmocerus hayati TaxID=131215 RepID=A0ACC2PHZ8_9HYME|nr:hypothetical protein QAD02_017839 [Eretmocerus hayati]
MASNLKKDASKTGYGKPETLQAVVFADDYMYDLKPAQRVCPGILLPVLTCPLLDYVLETLIRSKVQQVFLYCSSHVEKLKAYVQSSSKYLLDQQLVLTPIFSDGCRSLGDAMRDIDTKGCIRGDFILIRGTAFTNVDLKSLMDVHRLKKEKDKNTAMTMLFRDMGSVRDSALKNESSILVSNAQTKKILYYKKFVPHEKKIELELQWFLEQDRVNIDTALFDTRIYLCSQSVLPLFADNFDFQTMEDLIRGVLMNEEFLDSRIYWELLTAPAYAMPISSWKAYQILSKDILQRQCYPLVPDTLPISLRDFLYLSRSTYKHNTSTLSKGCVLQSESIIGEKSLLGENSEVRKSVIGPDCKIGMNVLISNSYIISNVVIEDNCKITDSIIFTNCIIEKNRKLDGCILLPNVTCSEDYSNTFIETENDGKMVVKNMGKEVIDSLLRGYQDQLKCENLILEINSSRYAYNVTIRQVSYNVIKAILSLPLLDYASRTKSTLNPKTQAAEYLKSLRAILSYFQPVIENYIKTVIAQEDCLRALKDSASKNRDFVIPCAQTILHHFYDNDILSEDKIIDWFERGCEYDDQTHSDNDDISSSQEDNIAESLRKTVSPFIKWLKEAEEDSSSS